MIVREELVSRVKRGLRDSPVTAILGPRQCGKTTLARAITSGRKRSAFFDLESPLDDARLRNPSLVLGGLRGLVVLDEVQRRPDLMPLLRVLADRRPAPCRFLLLGSASPELMRDASETLAGRIHFVDMAGFTIDEVGRRAQRRLWLRGGFPNSYLARSDTASASWRDDFIRTFLERDLPQLGILIPATTLRRFWTMVAHYHGQTLNSSEIGASLGVAHTTVRRYLDILSGAFVVRQLPPWFENLGKRVVRAPKIYVRDSGLLHSLLSIASWDALESHPKLGASWEGFALEQVLRWADSRQAYFWATHGGAELDLLLHSRGKRWGFEFKCQDAPTMTRSIGSAIQDLDLTRVWIVYPGDQRYPVHEKVECIGLSAFPDVRRRLSSNSRQA